MLTIIHCRIFFFTVYYPKNKYEDKDVQNYDFSCFVWV
jgi:hypothetical protein